MLNNISKFFSLRQLTIPVLGLVLTVGVLSEQTKPVLSQQTQKAATSTALSDDFPKLTNPQNYNTESKFTNLLPTGYQKSSKKAGVTAQNIPTKDGIYLYGQSPTANQLGQGYIVFEKRQGKVTGAMYMPSSEFSCFQGTIDASGELAMTVNAPPSETAVSDVAATSKIPTVSDDQFNNYSYSIALRDFHPIKFVSANDHRILQMCQGMVTGS